MVGPGNKAGKKIKNINGKLQDPTVYAYWLEFGIKPHTITRSTRKVLAFDTGGGRRFARTVQHPGVKPIPFMRRAWESNKNQAFAAIGKKAREVLEKEARKP